MSISNPSLISELYLEIARGKIPGVSHMNKFGRSTNVDQSILTDIWDRANVTDVQHVWTAPTQARKHNIASSSSSDDGNGGVGARTVKIYGLVNWDTAEVTEVKTLDGTNDVETDNAYVLIHRMKVLTKGATSVNVGKITATAQTDDTITAQINSGEGQTQMTIYGIPSTQTAYMTGFYSSVVDRIAAADKEVVLHLCYNPEPDTELIGFLVKHTFSIGGSGTSTYQHAFRPVKEFVGPGIIKMNGRSDANNMDIAAGFDLILEDN